MNEGITNMTEMRLRRISEHPLDVKGNYIVMDNLERGVIEILEHNDADTPLYFQWEGDTAYIKGATLVGKTSISVSEEEKAILVDELYYKEGHEELKEALVKQIMEFANFYGKYKKIGFTGTVLGDWFNDLFGE